MSLPIVARVLPLLGGVLLLVVLALAFSPSTFQSATMARPPYSAPLEQNNIESNILDGCHHVYLDMGSNM